MGLFSAIGKFFSFLVGGGSEDRAIQSRERLARNILDEERDEAKLQKGIEKKAGKTKDRLVKLGRGIAWCYRKASPVVRIPLKKSWGLLARLKKDQEALAEGNLTPSQEKAVAERDTKIENELQTGLSEANAEAESDPAHNPESGELMAVRRLAHKSAKLVEGEARAASAEVADEIKARREEEQLRDQSRRAA